MRITFEKMGNVSRSNSSMQNIPKKQRTDLIDRNIGDSISFTGLRKPRANKFKILAAAALLSIAGHSQAITRQTNHFPATSITQRADSLWNKFSHSEKKIIEKVENIVAKRYKEEGAKTLQKDSTEIIKQLNIKEKHKPLVKNLLEQYEANETKGFYLDFVNSPNLSPRKQELADKAQKLATDYTLDTGKILRYNDENIKGIAQKIGATEEELPFIDLFLKPQLDIFKGQKSSDGLFEKTFLGNLNN